MKSYERIYTFLTEGVDKEAFKNFWSQHEKAGARRAKPTRASKRTRAMKKKWDERRKAELDAAKTSKEATDGKK